MLEADTEYGKTYCIFCFKETEYVMNMMEYWMTLNDLEAANTKCNYKCRYCESIVKKSNIGSHLDCTFTTVNRYNIKKIGATTLSH